MAIVCPACNKAGQAEAVCQRCGCDLSQLHAIVAAAASRLSAAAASLAGCDWPGALVQAERSWRLCHTPASAQVAFLAASAAGAAARALRWRERASAAESGSERATPTFLR
ncbi:MAG: hypothetical protein ACREF9_17750 [Opitutaceae bacterium]